MARFTRNQNCIRALVGILPGAYMGAIMLKNNWGILLGLLLTYGLSFLLMHTWRIKNRWARSVVVALVINFILSLIHSSLLLHHQGRHLIHSIGRFIMASGIIAIATINSWLVAFLALVLIDYLIARLIKPKP